LKTEKVLWIILIHITGSLFLENELKSISIYKISLYKNFKNLFVRIFQVYVIPFANEYTDEIR
jgi:hypothetical protein